MTPQEFLEVLEYTHKNNGWQHTMLDRKTEDGKWKPLIKYVTSHFDTRDGCVWNIIFKEMTRDVMFNTHINKDNMMEEIYKYLNGEDATYKVIKIE